MSDNAFDCKRDSIFLALGGSQAHGTSSSESDVDLRGVCIVPLRTRLSLFERFEQFEGTLEGELASEILPTLAAHATAKHSLSVKVETVIFDVAKFLSLCANANPNALEILFTHQDDWILESDAWRLLHSKRHRFLTQKVQHTYLGYALAQLRRIKLHREKISAPHTRAHPRNQNREKLEKLYGYDTKHAAHLVRLMESGLEVLQTGSLNVRRQNADELRSIREGALPYDALLERASSLEEQMKEAAKDCSLPSEVDSNLVDSLLLELVRRKELNC